MKQRNSLPDQSIKIKFFYSYSSEDEEWLNKLKNHLSIFRRTGEIDVDEVDYKNFIPGENWQEAMCNDLYSADIVLLLLSSSFFASDYCFSELEIAVELMGKGFLRVIPIYLRYCHVKIAGLEKLNWLPSRKHPIVDRDYWSSEDKAFFKVTEGLDKVIEEVKIEKKNVVKTNQKIKTKSTRPPKKTQKPRPATTGAKKTEEVKTKKKQRKNTRQKTTETTKRVQKTNPKTPREKKTKEKYLQPKKKKITKNKSKLDEPKEKPGILRNRPLLASISFVLLISVFVMAYWIISNKNEDLQENSISGGDKSVFNLHRPNRHWFEVDYPAVLDITLNIKRDGQNLSMNLYNYLNMIIASSVRKNSSEKIIYQDVEKGEYYVDVFLADDTTGSEYELTIKRTSTPRLNGNQPGTGDSKGIAIPLYPPITIKDNIFLQTKIKSQRYTFYIDQTSIIEVDFSIEKNDLSLSVDLKDIKNKTLISMPNCKAGTIIKEKLPKGKYYILVYSGDEFYIEDYKIEINKLIEDPASGFIKKE